MSTRPPRNRRPDDPQEVEAREPIDWGKSPTTRSRSALLLDHIAATLGVPASVLIDPLTAVDPDVIARPGKGDGDQIRHDVLELARAFSRIDDHKLRLKFPSTAKNAVGNV